MDVGTCWKWFNEVFFLEVKKRTGRRVLLLMDNAPGHFECFERDNVKVAFSPANCTSWKQPCDLGIIAALKKRYKYLYLKEVLEFYELDENSKSHKKEQSKRLRRGAAGVAYGNPAHLLDAALFVKDAWDAISASTIKNAFKKADLLKLDDCTTEEIDEIAPDILHNFKSLNISITKDELEQFMHIDDESSEQFALAILEDVNEVLTDLPSEYVPMDMPWIKAMMPMTLLNQLIALIFTVLMSCTMSYKTLRISYFALMCEMKLEMHSTNCEIPLTTFKGSLEK